MLVCSMTVSVAGELEVGTALAAPARGRQAAAGGSNDTKKTIRTSTSVSCCVLVQTAGCGRFLGSPACNGAFSELLWFPTIYRQYAFYSRVSLMAW
ncbi:hypothetical protein BJY04DRAFT_137840 [Aspergillus karnatakaensis]|uniref:uncharacterized protein n=1 Tax=Aspergillus karnatakaensis TaxID=1810916 RepID=UPI003CCDBD7C